MAEQIQRIKKCRHALTCPLLSVKEKGEVIGVKIKEIKTQHGIINVIENLKLKENEWGIV